MAWIESHQSLRDHRKTKALQRALRIKTPQAVGHLHLIWWWCLDNAPDGDLSNIPDEDLADAAMWTGDPKIFVTTLIVAGFIDQETRQLHDWFDYAGKLLDKTETRKEQNRQAQQRHRAKFTHNINPRQQDVSITQADSNTPTVPNRTQPNRTQPNRTLPEKEEVKEETAATTTLKKDGVKDFKNLSEEPGKDNSEEIGTVAQVDADSTEQDPNLTAIVLCYEQNIGMLSPVIADELKDLAGKYSAEWFAAAVKEACEANARRLKYVVRVLERWEIEGFKTPRQEGKSKISSDPDKFINQKFSDMVKR